MFAINRWSQAAPRRFARQSLKVLFWDIPLFYYYTTFLIFCEEYFLKTWKKAAAYWRPKKFNRLTCFSDFSFFVDEVNLNSGGTLVIEVQMYFHHCFTNLLNFLMCLHVHDGSYVLPVMYKVRTYTTYLVCSNACPRVITPPHDLNWTCNCILEHLSPWNDYCARRAP